MLYRTLFIIFIIPLQFLINQSVYSVESKREITYTGHPEYVPVSYVDAKKSNVHTGVMPELVALALKELGYKSKSVSTGTWARAQEEVRRGRIDILIPPYRTAEREEWLLFQVTPIMMDETAIFVPKNSNKLDSYKSYQDLKGFKGVALINDSFGDEFDKFDKETLKMQRLTTTEQCFKFLSKGRADYLVAGLHAGNNVLKQHNIVHEFKIIPKRIIVTGMYVGISKKSSLARDPIFVEKFNKKLNELIDRGLVQDLLKKY